MRYDPAGNLQSLTNPNGEEYYFAYDAEGRRLSYTGLDGVSNTYELDALGLPVHVRLAVDTDLETHLSYERDKLGRVISRSGEAGVSLCPERGLIRGEGQVQKIFARYFTAPGLVMFPAACSSRHVMIELILCKSGIRCMARIGTNDKTMYGTNMRICCLLLCLFFAVQDAACATGTVLVPGTETSPEIRVPDGIPIPPEPAGIDDNTAGCLPPLCSECRVKRH